VRVEAACLADRFNSVLFRHDNIRDQQVDRELRGEAQAIGAV
jgi:hypothetical protein